MLRFRLPLIVAALMIGLLLTSCLRSVTTITVAQDHSAVLVDTTLLGSGALIMMKQFSSISKKSIEELLAESFSESKIKRRAGNMGKGVKLKSLTKLTGKQKGYVSTYTIDDVNNFTYNRWNALEKGSSTSSTQITTNQYNAPLKFTYVDSVLTIMVQQTNYETEENVASSTDAEARKQIDNLKKMLSDLYVAVRVIPEAPIISSNASYVENGVITLVLFDMGTALNRFEQDLSLFRQFVEARGSESGLRALAERMGCCFALETQPTIRTVLRND